MKNAFRCIKTFVFLYLLGFQQLMGSHYMGLDIYYDCLGGGFYKVTIKAYRDCEGIDLSFPPGVNLLGIGCASTINITSQLVEVGRQQVTPICGGFLTKCDDPNASLNGVEEVIWEAVVDLSAAPCQQYQIEVEECCRNGAITNIANPGSASIYSGDTKINLALPICNSSPRFANLPVPYICLNQNFTFNQGAIDPDGDSLVYRIGSCYNANGANMNYINGATATAPVISNPGMTINSQTGDITMTPTNIQVAIMCVFVDEYRNGVLIGTIERDIQIKVLNCGNLIPESQGFWDASANPTFNNSDTLCANQPGTAVIQFNDNNPGQILTATCLNCPFNFTFNSLPGVNTTATIDVPALPASSTPYTFVVRVTDDYCPLPGYQEYTYNLYLLGSVFTVEDSVSTLCNKATFRGHAVGGNPPYQFSWTGDGNLNTNLNNSDSVFTHVYPAPGTYHYTLAITDANNCTYSVTDSVTVTNSLSFNAGNDTSTCSNQSIVLGSTAIPGYNYRWRPSTGLSDSTIAQPTFNLANFGTTAQTITYIVTISDTACSAVDIITVTVYPTPQPNISGPTDICLGDFATLSSDTASSYLWSNGATTQTITVSPSDTTTYTLTTVSLNGCPSAIPGTFTLNVIPPMLAEIQGDTALCLGDATTLQAPVGNSYQWTELPSGALLSSNPLLTVTPGLTTQYVLNMKFGPCDAIPDTVTVLVNPPLDATFSVPSTTCLNEPVTVTYTGSTPVANYIWDFGTATILSGSGQGPYSILFQDDSLQTIQLIQDQNGCQDTFEVIVYVKPIPLVDASPDTFMCKNQTFVQIPATISLSGVCQYFWTPTTGLDDPNVLSPKAFPQVTTTYYLTAVCGGCTSMVDSVTVFAAPLPQLTLTNPVNNICQGDSVLLNGTLSGGNGTLVVQWSPSAGLSDSTIANPVAMPDTTTIYTVVVTDSLGCHTDTSLVYVIVNPNPIAEAGNDTLICKGSGFFLNGIASGTSGPYGYQWTPITGLSNANIRNPFANPLVSTTYYLQTTNLPTGCVSVLDSIVITVDEKMPHEAGPDQTVCLGTGVQIGTTGTIGRTYQWTPAIGLSDAQAADPIATPPFTTLYYVSYTENGCISATDSVLVTVLGSPTIDAGDTSEICPGQSVQLHGLADGVPGPFTYHWTPGESLDDSTAQNPIATPSQTTTYYLFASANGCEGVADSVVVWVKPVPTVDADTTNSVFWLCQGESVQIPAKVTSALLPVSVYWTPSTGLDNPYTINPIATPDTTTVYYLQAEAGGCLSTVEQVVVRVTPKLDITLTATDTMLCNGHSTQLILSGVPNGATVTWIPLTGLSNPSNTGAEATPSSDQMYKVVVIHEVCSDSDSVVIHVNPQPIALFTASENINCNSLEVSFLDLSTEAAAWSWNFGDGHISNVRNPIHIYDGPGSYVVTLSVTGTGGCPDQFTYSDTINVREGVTAYFNTNPQPLVEMILPESNVQFIDSSINATFWYWEFGDGYSSTDSMPSHRYLEPGNYYAKLVVTDSLGCVSEYAMGPFLVILPELSIPNVFSPNGDGVNDEFRVTYTGHSSFEMYIYDRWGKEYFRTKNPQEGWKGQDLLPGVYYYAIKIGDNIQSGPITLVK